MERRVCVVAVLVISALLAPTHAMPEHMAVGHRLMKRSLEFSSSVQSSCQQAGLAVYECYRTWSTSLPPTSDPQFLQKFCRSAQLFYTCSVSASSSCSDYTLRNQLQQLRVQIRNACPRVLV